MMFTCVAGCRYKASIKLNFVQRLASNDMIKSKLEEVGLKDVVVTGSGGLREAEGTATETATVNLPDQIVPGSVVKI